MLFNLQRGGLQWGREAEQSTQTEQMSFWPLIKEVYEWHTRSLLKGILLWTFLSHLAQVYFHFGPDIFAEMHPILPPMVTVLPNSRSGRYSLHQLNQLCWFTCVILSLMFLGRFTFKPFHVFRSQERIFVAHFAVAVINWAERQQPLSMSCQQNMQKMIKVCKICKRS